MFRSTLLPTLAPFHLLTHPFYVAWMKGELTVAQLQSYGAQYYPHVDAFPRYISAAHQLCEDPAARRELAMNLADEEGINAGSPHPELWLDFCEGLGLSREEVKTSEIRPAAKALRDGFFTLARSSYAEGLGALIAYEYQVPEISKSKIEGLEKNYAIRDARTLKFFRVHEEADVFHSEACGKAFDALSEADRDLATAAAVKASRLLWDFLSEAYATDEVAA